VTYNKSGLKRVVQWHLGVLHIQSNNHVGTVLSGGGIIIYSDVHKNITSCFGKIK
jgi:hypothetical protein